ncbi:MAG: hypothetical protein MI749_02070 [Desulfovibrionales bacterium]|nr:hypothetical protein [Desulfovibrionales bacterium]
MLQEWKKFALLILLICVIWLIPYCHADKNDTPPKAAATVPATQATDTAEQPSSSIPVE